MTRRKARLRTPLHRPALGLVLAAAALAALPAAAPAQSDAAGVQVVRTQVPLDVAAGDLGAWRPVKMRPEARVGFRRVGDARRRVVRLSDGRRRSGYVTLGTSLAPQTAVSGRADVNLTRQRLGRGRARALITVASASGESVQAGVVRARSGGLRWAVWNKSRDDERSGVVVSDARATRGAWHRIDLRTRWARPGARAVLRVDGRPVARTRPRDLSGVLAQRVLLGLGRPSSAEETGTLLVRSAEVSAAVGVPAPAPEAAPAPAPATPAPEPAPAPASAAPAPAATTPTPGATTQLPGREILRADWETGDTSQFSSVQTVSSDRIRPVTNPVRQGRYAGRFEVRPGDDPLGYGDRAEVSISTRETEGDERWYSWSTMVAPGFPSTAGFQVISQWHSRADGRPPVAFFAENDDLVLFVHRYAAPGQQLSTTRAWSAPLPRGVWQDIVMHVKWSGSDRVGFIELWVNGQRQTLSNGQTRLSTRTMYPGIDNYFKQGYYRQYGIRGTGVVYHDGFRMSSAS